jgi:bifunctional N-acetylglucosamine-1-phosphate-uridyltransferase/glucosamine-1-phosphate-acetyltransferase GlmU-like protein
VSWRGVIAALDPAVRYQSRISVYQHPLAGRPVLWHVIAALASVDPPPALISVLHREESVLTLPPDPTVPVETVSVPDGEDAQAMRRTLGVPGMFILADGSAPLMEAPSLARLLRAGEDGVVALGSPIAVAVAGEGLALVAADDPLRPDSVASLAPGDDDELLRIDDRAAFAQAAVLLRDRIVRRHQRHGVTFLLPETILIDVEVTIGADTIIYPGAVLEGQTEIGNECVIGPHSRVVEAQIGRGVELKGWNYVARTSIRNHAVLDPYVRRGYD